MSRLSELEPHKELVCRRLGERSASVCCVCGGKKWGEDARAQRSELLAQLGPQSSKTVCMHLQAEAELWVSEWERIVRAQSGFVFSVAHCSWCARSATWLTPWAQLNSTTSTRCEAQQQLAFNDASCLQQNFLSFYVCFPTHWFDPVQRQSSLRKVHTTHTHTHTEMKWWPQIWQML